ncbi:MAG TPA: hypothetical protein VNY05_41855 [Candidatus Acidoferrales bacterium]|nr:hypothetical protein [Candidatus Acidoferrales bacterium]
MTLPIQCNIRSDAGQIGNLRRIGIRLIPPLDWQSAYGTLTAVTQM